MWEYKLPGQKCFREESNFTTPFTALMLIFEYSDGSYSGKLGLKDKINDGLSLPKLKIAYLFNISEVFGSASLFLLWVLNQICVR